MEFADKVAVITGGAHGIGRCISSEFAKQGAKACIIDLQENPYFQGDLADKAVLEHFAAKVIAEHDHVDYLINNAAPLMKGITECSYEEFEYAQRVGVTAPFYLTKLFMPHFAPGAAIVNISSSRDRMSQPETESYTAAKGGIAALTHALAVSLAGKAGSIPYPPAGLIPHSTPIAGLMPYSSPPGALAHRWILPTWCCIFVLKGPGSSQGKISALTGA